jgi:three-Cys-motif partner protein
MSKRAARPWGYWTRAKLAILNDYLPAFLQAASGKSNEYVYLDAFAGEGRGVDRLTGEEFQGSSRIALAAKALRADTRFTRLRYFEQASKARELEARHRQQRR